MHCFILQVVNQWETNSSQMPKQRKMDESKTSALHFCKIISRSHFKMLYYGRWILNVFLFSSWQAEVCQRSPECSPFGLWERAGETAFLQTRRQRSQTRETESFHDNSSRDAFPAQYQEKAASVGKVWRCKSKSSNKTFVLINSFCGGHWLDEQLLMNPAAQHAERSAFSRKHSASKEQWLLIHAGELQTPYAQVAYIFMNKV